MLINIQDKLEAVTQPSHIYSLLNAYFEGTDKIDQDKEHFFVIHLDSRNKIKLFELISIGTVNASIVHPREVFTRAVGERSAQIVLAHNHPSGNVEPSDEDIQTTKRMEKAGRILGIEVVDHIIYTETGYFSFKERRLI